MLIYSMGVSLDGFINDREGAFGWSAPDDELFRFHTGRVSELGGCLLGRRLYETMLVWDTDPSLRDDELGAAFADVWCAIPKVVFSRTLDGVQGNARLAEASLAEEIAAAPRPPAWAGGAGDRRGRSLTDAPMPVISRIGVSPGSPNASAQSSTPFASMLRSPRSAFPTKAMPMRNLPHVDPTAPRGVLYRAFARLTGTRVMGVVSRGVIWKLDPLLLRLTGGRLGLGMLLPTALLETRGARTGSPRQAAVIYFHDGDRVTIVASKLGLPDHPAWFHNLQANPDVRFGGRLFRATVVADEAERTRLWALADRVFPPYAAYRRRAASAGRTIPLVQLVPVGDEVQPR